MLNKILLFFIISQSALAYGSLAENRIVEALKKDFSWQVKQTTREIRVYHYFAGQDHRRTQQYYDELFEFSQNHPTAFDIFDPDDPAWKNSHFIPTAKKFFLNNDPNSNFGGGLYAMFDPNGSKSYGKLLLEISIQRGTNFIDTRGSAYDSSFQVSEQTYNLLRQSCPGITGLYRNQISKDGVPYLHIAKQHLMSSPICYRASLKVFKELKIEFLVYQWYKDGFIYHPCKGEKEGASFVLTGLINSPHDPNDVDFSSFDVKGYMTPFINKQVYMNRVSNNFDYKYLNSYLYYISSKGLFDEQTLVERSFIDSEIKEHRFGCRRDLYPEDLKKTFD